MTDFDVFVVDTEEAFQNLQDYVAEGSFDHLVIDVETDSKYEKKAKLYGIGLSFKDNEAFYIPIRAKDGSLVFSGDALSGIADWLHRTSNRLGIIGHNLIYDVLVLENNFGLDFTSCIHSDTILQKHTLDSERPFGLKELAVKYLGDWADKAQKTLYDNIKENGGSTTKESMEMFKADTLVLADYCGWDVLLTRMLYNRFEAQLQEEGLHALFYTDEIMPLYKEVTIEMKRRGFRVDVAYFEKLRDQITTEICKLEDEVMSDIHEYASEYERTALNEDYPVKKTGNFPKMLAEIMGVQLPVNKEGNVTLAKKALEQAAKADPESQFYKWMLSDAELPAELASEVQKASFLRDKPDSRYVFNLKSNDHLAWLLFDKLGETPLAHTETGKPQCDEDYLDSVKDGYGWVTKLIDFKKLMKLSSTYIDGILDRQIDGIVYTSMLQFGTTSGRYSSREPNLQNVPRVKDDEADLSPLVLTYTNAIKKGFVAPAGYKILNADYSSLEPVCFAHMSGDEKLREVFRKGFDLYSAIAIEVFGVQGCSANKKDKNYLKNLHPELRQKAKVFCLAVVYGAEAGRISQAMSINYQEADEIIGQYLDAYPNLKKYMQRCDTNATKRGEVRTEFGRVRKLPIAKDLYERWGNKLFDRRFCKQQGIDDIRYKFKNALNNSKNFPIQGLAAHIVNRAMIATVRAFKQHGLDAYPIMQVHDEITCLVREDQAELAKRLLRECMENTTKISVPLYAEPLIADNWAEAK